jgi:hypothetical protein
MEAVQDSRHLYLRKGGGEQATIGEERRAARWMHTPRSYTLATVHTVGYTAAPDTSIVCLRMGVEV